MKKFFMWAMIALLTVGGFISLEAKPPKGWMLNLRQAQAKARKEGKPILVVVSGSDWCPPCKALQKTVLNNKKFLDYARRNAVLCFIDIKRNKVNVDAGKIPFYKGGVPAYGCVDHNLKVLDVPATRTVKGFNDSIRDARKKVARPRVAKKKAARK